MAVINSKMTILSISKCVVYGACGMAKIKKFAVCPSWVVPFVQYVKL